MPKQIKNKIFQKSFTLIELLVVIAIIGILAAIAIPSLSNARAKARDARRAADLTQMATAMELYYSDNNHYPVWEAGGIFQSATNPLKNDTTSSPAFFTAEYMKTIPKDPLPNKYDYYYKLDSTGANYKLATFLEKDKEKALNDNDGGTAPSYYEVFAGPTGSGTVVDIDDTDLNNAMPGHSWACGDTVTFTYGDALVTYGTTVSHNNECWLDRNLGASRVATAYNDSNAYGDLFQWGRLDDGHQKRNSNTTTTLSLTDNPGHSNFIIKNELPYDWREPQNDILWHGDTSINNPCPIGWRVPTGEEWRNEMSSWGTCDWNGAYNSVLKIPAAGWRNNGGSEIVSENRGNYWCVGTEGTRACHMDYGIDFLSRQWCIVGTTVRIFGGSVRCIKN